MKTKETILKAFASLALAVGAFASADAQTNLGASCGCPPVGQRTIVNVTDGFPGYVAINGTYGGELTQNTTFTCDKIYILKKKIYVPSGKTLTIQPGTLIKGGANTIPAEATALTIERGGKIMALGTESCPIVFTAEADPMDGTYPIYQVGKWGGVVVLGKATNNLTLAANGPFVPGGAGKLAVADGLGTVEGFASSNPQDQYGVATSIPSNYATGTSPATSTYTFDVAATGTSNSSGFQRFTVPSAVSTFILNGMTVTGTGIGAGAVVSSSSTSGSTTTVVLSTTGTVLSGPINASFVGTYPLATNTSGYFYSQTAPATLLNPTGPIVTGINYAIPFIGTVGGTFDDDDNSGVMKYVSIRHGGAILAVGAEINGLTLASVGRGTTIDHIEIVSCADDNIEVFGGTVNLKYITTLFGNDDMFDYDLGYTGNVQFFFGMKNTGPNATTGLGSPDNDNGIEGDSDDNTSSSAIKSNPKMYNFTIIGNGKSTGTSDNRGVAAAQFKEGSAGELYNSIFANFKNGVNLQTQSGTRTGGDSHENWLTAETLKIKCNSFVGIGGTAAITGPPAVAAIENNYLVKNANSLASVGTQPTPADTAKFLVTDLNTAYFDRALNYATTPASASNVTEPTAIPGFTYAFTVSATNAVSVKNDVTPNPVLTLAASCPVAPVDGFFEPAAYRGAFSSQAGNNWLSDWTYSKVIGATSGVVACPTDLNNDGVTNVSDFGIFAPQFGLNCN